MYYKIIIWENVTKFGQNFIAPQIFFAGTAMLISRGNKWYDHDDEDFKENN